jgi:hypothetical protein
MQVVSALRSKAGGIIFERHGLDTRERVHLPIHDAERILYAPATRGALRRTLPAADVTDRDVFLDVGSGKGRVLMEAAHRYEFQRVVGVELVTELHETAERNLEISRSKLHCPVELVNCDIVDYVVPDDVTVIFMFNPFRGEPFRVFLRNLTASLCRRPRPLTVIYEAPTELNGLLGTGLFEVTKVIPPQRGGLDNYPYGWIMVAKSAGPEVYTPRSSQREPVSM